MSITTHTKPGVVTTIVTYDCGCGFRTEDEAKARDHAKWTWHTMTVHGRILTEQPDGEGAA